MDASRKESDILTRNPLKRLSEDGQSIERSKLMRGDNPLIYPHHYPLAFPFYPVQNRGESPRTSKPSSPEFLQQLSVRTGGFHQEGSLSPPLSTESDRNERRGSVNSDGVLMTPPTVTSPWNHNSGDDKEVDVTYLRKRSSEEKVDEKTCPAEKPSIVSHSIERLMGGGESKERKEFEKTERRPSSPKEERSETEPDSTQPDEEARRSLDRTEERRHSIPHEWSRNQSASLTPPSLLNSVNLGFPSALLHQYQQQQYGGSLVGNSLPGPSLLSPHPYLPSLGHLSSLNSLGQYAAVQQYAQQVAHHVAVAQLQAAQRAAMDEPR